MPKIGPWWRKKPLISWEKLGVDALNNYAQSTYPLPPGGLKSKPYAPWPASTLAYGGNSPIRTMAATPTHRAPRAGEPIAAFHLHEITQPVTTAAVIDHWISNLAQSSRRGPTSGGLKNPSNP